MAVGQGISTLTSGASITLADGDLLEVTDISDTTGSDDGTSKKVPSSVIRTYMRPQNTPDALTGSPTLGFWYDADDLAGSDGSSVSAWADASASGYDLSQGTGGKQPVLKTALPSFNGHKAVRFDGTDDTLTALSTGAGSWSTHSAFCVCYNPNTVGGDLMILDARGSWFIDIIQNGSVFKFRAGGNTDTADPAGSTMSGVSIVIGVYDGADILLYVNGQPVARKTTSGAMTPSNIYVGSNADVGAYSNVDLAELGAYSTGLSRAQVRELNNGLCAKYGLSGVML